MWAWRETKLDENLVYHVVPVPGRAMEAIKCFMEAPVSTRRGNGAAGGFNDDNFVGGEGRVAKGIFRVTLLG